MDLFNGQTQTFMPGQRLVRVRGYEAADKYALPRDCEAIFIDEDEDVCYIKKTDTNGGEKLWMYDMTEKELPRFDPTKYVTKKDFDSFKEDILNGFNDIKQAIANSGTKTKRQSDSATE